jgi:hypothetical protein
MKFAAFLCSAMLATPAFADGTATIDLPAGSVEISHSSMDFTATLTAAGQSLNFESAYLPDIIGISDNSVLIFLSTGGTGCPGTYAWVTREAGGLRATEPFGTCSDIGELQQAPDGPMLVMPRLGTTGTAGYTLLSDGRIMETELGLKSAGVSDPTDADAWIGMAAYDVFSAAEMEPVLLSIMSWEQLEEVRNSSVISGETMTAEGDWIAAGGCRPHMCNEERSGIAISRKTGTPIVAHWSKDIGGTLYGTPDTAVPNRIRSLLAGN